LPLEQAHAQPEQLLLSRDGVVHVIAADFARVFAGFVCHRVHYPASTFFPQTNGSEERRIGSKAAVNSRLPYEA